MKLALVLAFALLALSLPAAAAATAPVAASIQAPAADQVPNPEFLRATITYYCWYLDQTSCNSVGATQTCTDVCDYFYTCTCQQPWGGGSPVWACPSTC
ncbi:MAG TPA: hypothetical protein VGS22_27845 [Thermoanaerobaculia bacterium]|jgi:hypothetical protein|nr:hypothetical protein [Thermoanaerobaculia bacterium]